MYLGNGSTAAGDEPWYSLTVTALGLGTETIGAAVIYGQDGAAWGPVDGTIGDGPLRRAITSPAHGTVDPWHAS